MMDQQENVFVVLGRIEANVQATKDIIERHTELDDKVHQDHETRIRRGEKVMYTAAGVLLLVMGGGAFSFI